jgi:hypothetical protein
MVFSSGRLEFRRVLSHMWWLQYLLAPFWTNSILIQCRPPLVGVLVKHEIIHNHPQPPPNQRLITQVDRARWADSTKTHNHPNGCNIREISNKY